MKNRPKQSICEQIVKMNCIHLLTLAQERLSPMWYAFFRLPTYTGMRRGEALALKWSDLDEDAGTLSTVQDRLGHSDVKTTIDIYNHVYEADETKALNRFIDFMDA
ncbi:hypothetical protein BHK98_12525 [Hornefia porci]|uniref:Tyr recombinase domain-containing protein n=1 Tax=Hornefia porci TaxID=2652292 RepID=A0A1Q9JKW5_9FIRM|nr:hypothetical protein [Hornefia porci]OLR56816.1 hypothetical protein BHK98_12525 [Hornefia porci]